MSRTLYILSTSAAFVFVGLVMREGVPQLKEWITGRSVAQEILLENEDMAYLYQAIAQHDPAEAAYWEENVELLIEADASVDFFRGEMRKLGQRWRLNNSHRVAQGSIEAIETLIAIELETIEYIRDNFSLSDCNAYAWNGYEALDEWQLTRLEQQLDYSRLTLALVEAVYGQRFNRAMASDSDYQRLNTAFVEGRGSVALLNEMMAGDADSPYWCEATIAYFQTALYDSFPGRDRVLASLSSGQ